MRSILILFGLLISFSAMAQPKQPPRILQHQENIDLTIGESRTFEFAEPFGRIGTATEGVAVVLPQSDRQLTISGLKAGQTTMFVQGTQGDMYLATVTVTPGSGHLVRFYGYPRDVTKDYIGFYCSEFGCGRADQDKVAANGGRDPDEPTMKETTVTRPLPGGGSTTSTRRTGSPY